jgi:hypothetical protein
MRNLSLRYQRVGDAKRFFQILTHPDFVLFPVNVKSIEEEKRFLRTNKEMRARARAYRTGHAQTEQGEHPRS